MRLKNPLKTAGSILFLKSPLEAQIIVTRRCNLSCGYCTEYDSVSKPVPFEEIKTWIDSLHRLRVFNTSLLGGEPLMHPQVAEIVEYSARKNQVSITTNAFLITKEMIEKLNKAGLSNMEVSIDRIDVDRTGFIQKNLKTLRPKLELLKEHAAFDVHVNLVLCESTKDRMKETVDSIRAMGFRVSIDLLHKANGQIDIEGEDYIKVWDEHFSSGAPFTDIDYKYGRELLQGKKPKWKCRAGSRVLYVDEFGKAQYCSSQRGVLDKPINDYTFEDLKAQSKKYKGCEEGCALLCIYRDSMLDNETMTCVKAAVKAFTNGTISTKNKEPSPIAATAQ